ncbi:MAG: sigma-70 family RNA polymerase sigma factor [Planctomycetota bacterium]
MIGSMTTGFIARLRANDEAAWFELWETFGPVLRAQLHKWGKGRVGVETVRDLSQETLAALSNSIDRYDPSRGARFSTWLLAIAKHVLGDEIDRRMALKRGGGKANAELDETWMKAAATETADKVYEAAVFRAKVEASIRMTERESDFMDFSIYRMRVLDGVPGKEVAVQLGVSEPTVSRRLAKVRDLLREKLEETIALYSFTDEEREEAERNGVGLNPKNTGDKAADAMFDEAIADIYHRQMELRAADEAGDQPPV